MSTMSTTSTTSTRGRTAGPNDAAAAGARRTGRERSGAARTDPNPGVSSDADGARPGAQIRHWVATVSHAHVMAGKAGGFTQADHGRDHRLRRFGVGDRIAYYSPRTDYPVGDPLQQFTALATITGEDCYQVVGTEEVGPWRRAARFDGDAGAVAVRPLLDQLSFVLGLKQWGLPFRRGLFTVSATDFAVIERAMHAAARLAG